MAENDNEKQVIQWLTENGISIQHQQYLLEQDRLSAECREKSARIKVPSWRVGDMEFWGVGETVCDGCLAESIDFVISDEPVYVKAFQAFQNIKNNITSLMEVADLARLINPFSMGDYFDSYKHILVGKIINGSLSMKYFPWQNRNIVFLLKTPNFTSMEDRINYYSELPFEYQERAILSINSDSEPSSLINIWKSYLPADVVTIKINESVVGEKAKERSQKSINGKHFEFFREAVKAFHDFYPSQEMTDKSIWANLPELCPTLVLRIEGDGEKAKAIMKYGKPWQWRAFKESFKRYQKRMTACSDT